MERLRASQHSRQRLVRGAHNIIIRLLRSQGRTGGLCMEAQHHRARILRVEAVAHNLRPHATRRTELRHLLQQIIMAIKEEGELARKPVHIQPRVKRGPYIADGIRERECHLLHGGRASFTNMVATDADSIPAWQVFRAILEHISNDAHRMFRRVNIGAACGILFQNIILHRAGELAYLHPLLFGDRDIERQQDAGRRVNRHRGADAVERQAVEQRLHIFQAGNRDANLAHFAFGHRMVRIVAHLRWQIKGDREPRRALREQEMVAFIRFFRRSEACILPHCP